MVEDRTARAKLRDAAIEIVAEGGVRALTARGVAECAGLSPGLIRHHYGSMANLIEACDEHIEATIKEIKENAIHGGPSFDALAAVRRSGSEYLMGYLALRLADDSPQLNRLVDTIVHDAVDYMSDGVAHGLFAPTADERSRTAMLTIFALGSLTMYRHLERLLGVDIRAADLTAQPGFANYLRAQMEVFSGVVNPDVVAQYNATLTRLEEES